jgi:hypothetical protein
MIANAHVIKAQPKGNTSMEEVTIDVATLALAREQGKGVARLRAYK